MDRTPLHVLRLALLCLALASSGFVLQLLSFALPELVHAWQLPSSRFAAAFTVHLLGVTLGALAFGRLGDRRGRRQMLMAALLVQAAASFAGLLATTPSAMAMTRLVAGLGVGGMTPNAVALAMELAPPRWRTAATTVVLSGVALGSSLPALVVRELVPTHGWTVLFAIAGAASFLLCLLVRAFVPESGAFHDAHRTKGAGLGHLLTGELQRPTLCLWVMYAGAMLSMHLVTSWLPLLLEQAGLAAPRAASLTGVVHLAGAAATLSTAVLLARWGKRWLATLLWIALASAGLLALEGFATPHVAVLIAALGFGLVGSQGALGTLAGHLYPAECRPTGVGAAIAVGRAGSMLGPLAGGALQAAGWPAQGLFTLPLFALGAALVAAALFRPQAGGS
jgi:MFS transporter, AAHS family, 4-hydroxybenzoate transporter